MKKTIFILFLLLLMVVTIGDGVLEVDIADLGGNITYIASQTVNVASGVANGTDLSAMAINVTDLNVTNSLFYLNKELSDWFWNLLNFTNAFNAIYNISEEDVRQSIVDNVTAVRNDIDNNITDVRNSINLNWTDLDAEDTLIRTSIDDNITKVRADWWELINFTNAFNAIYNISDSSLLYNGSDVSLKALNLTDLNATGDVWIRDSGGEYHLMGRELTLRDEMAKNITLTGINGTFVDGVVTIESISGNDIIVNINANESSIGSNTDSIELTPGTNESPILNQIYYENILNPTLAIRTTFSESVPSVATFLMGSDNFTYASAVGATTTQDFVRGVYNRFFDDGAIYKSGFNMSVSTTEVNITEPGTLKVLLSNFNIVENHSTSDFYIHLHVDGSFHQHTSLDDCADYNNGVSVGNNKYFNMVFGMVITHDGEGRMIVLTQKEPSNEYTRAIDAENDIENTLVFFPSHEIMKKAFIPIVRVIVKRSGGVNTIQTLSSGQLFFDVRGTVQATASSPPTSGISSHPDLTNLGWGVAGHIFDTFIDLLGNDILGAKNIHISGYLNVSKRMQVGNEKVNISSAGDVNATKFYGDGSGLTNVAASLPSELYGHDNFTEDYGALGGWVIANFTEAFNDIYNISDTGLYRIANFTKDFNAAYNLSDSALLLNDTDVSLMFINASKINVTGNLTVVGRVGIGTNLPDSLFHIKGNFPGIVGNDYAGQIIIQNPADDVTSNVVITGYESDGSGNPDQQLWYLGSSSVSNSDIIFLNRRNAKLALGTNDVVHMTILGNGSVGIGTASPAAKLHISTVSGGEDLLFLRDQINTADLTINSPTGALMEIRAGVGDHLQLSSDATANQGIRIRNDGNVGIGTTTPAEDLTIGANKVNISSTGDVNATKFYGDGSALTGITGGQVSGAWVLSNFTNAFNAIYNLSDTGLYNSTNFTQDYNDLSVAWKLTNFTAAFNAAYNLTKPIENDSDASLKKVNVSILNTVTAANFAMVFDNSMSDTLHRHSELSASDGTPDAKIQVDATGLIGMGITPANAPLSIASNLNHGIIVDVYKSIAWDATIAIRKSSSNTIGTALVTADGEELGTLVFAGVASNDVFSSGAQIKAHQQGAAAPGRVPSRMTFGVQNLVGQIGTPIMVIDGPTRRVGIGIGDAEPAQALEIGGGNIMLENTFAYGIRLADTTQVSLMGVSAGDDMTIGSASINNLILTTGGSTILSVGGVATALAIIETTGNVGIGTGTPETRLKVIGKANITETVYAHNFSSNSDIVFVNGSGIGAELMRITERGFMGIGTIPLVALDVKGMGRFNQFNKAPASGSGVEIYLTSAGGNINPFNRSLADFLPLMIWGTNITLTPKTNEPVLVDGDMRVAENMTVEGTFFRFPVSTTEPTDMTDGNAYVDPSQPALCVAASGSYGCILLS